MQTVQIQLEDSKLDTFLNLIDNLKDGIVKNIRVKSNGIDEDTKAYMQTQQYQEDRAYFHKCYEDLKDGTTELLDSNQYSLEMDNFIDSLKSKYADNKK